MQKVGIKCIAEQLDWMDGKSESLEAHTLWKRRAFPSYLIPG